MPDETKIELRKVSDLIWEIPKTGGMRVPGRIFCSERLFESIKADKSPEQVANVAHLPGIVSYSLAMPDMHWGYGFPIGGVAATDIAEGGVVSPGGVGYDINCLAGDSRVLHQLGYTLTIAEMESSWKRDAIVCQDFSRERPASTPIVRYLKQRPRAAVYRVVTEAGDALTATADHPFWTPEGMVELGRLKVGDQVALHPFVGVPFQPPSDEVIADRAAVLRLLARHDKDARGNATGQILAQLDRRGLLPLRYNSPQLPYLLKLLGYVWGDGCIYFTNQRGKGATWFWGKPDDLEEIRADVKQLGFTPSRVYTRTRRHSMTTFYADYEFENTETGFKVVGSAFAALLAALGAPVGDKTTQDFRVPTWLDRAPLWQKRLFLAAFFGAELTAPKPFRERNYNFYAPVLSVSKREPYVASGRDFLRGIERLLAEFGVETKTISTRVEPPSHRLRLILSSKPESLTNLWSKVGFEYNQARRALANMATQYLKHKGVVTAERAEAAHEAVTLQAAGVAREDIFARLTSAHVNERFIERSLYEGRDTSPRVAANFMTFDEYSAKATAGLGRSGMVWERIARIEPVDLDGPVYDFTVAHGHHNFVANGFVVSNCGVRLAATDLKLADVKDKIETMVHALFANVPCGVGSTGGIGKLSQAEEKKMLVKGAEWVVENGFGKAEDLERTEEGGRLRDADPEAVSERALKRGSDEVGTLGSGNHFLELDVVDTIYDAQAAAAFGLAEGQLVLQIHSGSRGLGHQVCDDYIRIMNQAAQKYGIHVPDRELCCAPVNSPEAQRYLAAMACAANYAWANRQAMLHLAEQALLRVLKASPKALGMRQVYDVCHNIAKMEDHTVGGQTKKLCVHRKGATRAFPPGHPDVPAAYRAIGQPVLIPGDMGRCSYVLVGTQKAMEESWGTTCHGAGRTLSRTQAIKQGRGRNIQKEMAAKGIFVRSKGRETLAEEMSEAYKDVSDVVEVMHQLGITRKVARLRPVGVMKG